MTIEVSHRIAQYLRYISRTLLIMFACFFFVFALLSGADMQDGSVKGLVLNIPNTIPWLVLFFPILFAWKWEKKGGIGIILFGIFSFFFFDGFESPFVLIAISFPLVCLGIMLVASWYLRQKNDG